MNYLLSAENLLDLKEVRKFAGEFLSSFSANYFNAVIETYVGNCVELYMKIPRNKSTIERNDTLLENNIVNAKSDNIEKYTAISEPILRVIGISNYDIIFGIDGSKFVYYKVNLVSLHVDFSNKICKDHRYSSILNIYEIMSQSLSLPPFPKKSFISNFDSEFLKLRMQDLESWLQESHDILISYPLLLKKFYQLLSLSDSLATDNNGWNAFVISTDKTCNEFNFKCSFYCLSSKNELTSLKLVLEYFLHQKFLDLKFQENLSKSFVGKILNDFSRNYFIKSISNSVSNLVEGIWIENLRSSATLNQLLDIHSLVLLCYECYFLYQNNHFNEMLTDLIDILEPFSIKLILLDDFTPDIIVPPNIERFQIFNVFVTVFNSEKMEREFRSFLSDLDIYFVAQAHIREVDLSGTHPHAMKLKDKILSILDPDCIDSSLKEFLSAICIFFHQRDLIFEKIDLTDSLVLSPVLSSYLENTILPNLMKDLSKTTLILSQNISRNVFLLTNILDKVNFGLIPTDLLDALNALSKQSLNCLALLYESFAGELGNLFISDIILQDFEKKKISVLFNLAFKNLVFTVLNLWVRNTYNAFTLAFENLFARLLFASIFEEAPLAKDFLISEELIPQPLRIIFRPDSLVDIVLKRLLYERCRVIARRVTKLVHDACWEITV